MIVESNVPEDRCYTTSFWRPVLLPFTAVYDGYGGGEELNGISVKYIVDAYNKLAAPDNDNDSDDDSDNPHARMFMHGYKHITKFNGNVVNFVMMRKDVVDAILSSRTVEKFIGHLPNTTSNYTTYCWKDVVEDIPHLLKELQPWIDINDTYWLRDRSMKDAARSIDRLAHNKAAWHLPDQHHNSILPICVETLIVTAARRNDMEEATSLLTSYLMASYIDHYMDSIRKCWMPGGFEGSQDQEEDGYLLLSDVITRAIHADRKRFNES